MTLAELTPTIFYVVASIHLLLWGALIILFIAHFTKPSFYPTIKKHIRKYNLWYALFGSGLSTIGSLWLSEIAGYTPCKLCWWQRIFMYPSAVVSMLALTTTIRVKKILLTFSVLGGVIALYHYGIQRIGFIQQTIPCSVDASCSTMYLGYWGWYSIPVMALLGFTIIFVSQLYAKE